MAETLGRKPQETSKDDPFPLIILDRIVNVSALGAPLAFAVLTVFYASVFSVAQTMASIRQFYDSHGWHVLSLSAAVLLGTATVVGLVGYRGSETINPLKLQAISNTIGALLAFASVSATLAALAIVPWIIEFAWLASCTQRTSCVPGHTLSLANIVLGGLGVGLFAIAKVMNTAVTVWVLTDAAVDVKTRRYWSTAWAYYTRRIEGIASRSAQWSSAKRWTHVLIRLALIMALSGVAGSMSRSPHGVQNALVIAAAWTAMVTVLAGYLAYHKLSGPVPRPHGSGTRLAKTAYFMAFPICIALGLLLFAFMSLGAYVLFRSVGYAAVIVLLPLVIFFAPPHPWWFAHSFVAPQTARSLDRMRTLAWRKRQGITDKQRRG